MDKCCRTCRHLFDGLCYHPEMSTEEFDVYTEYVETLFDMGNVIEAVDECFPDIDERITEDIVATVARVLKNNLPTGEMNFSPADIREFYCSLYE